MSFDTQSIEEFSGIVLIIGEQAYTLDSKGRLLESRAKFHDVADGVVLATLSPPLVAEEVQVPAREMARLAHIRAALETAATSTL